VPFPGVTNLRLTTWSSTGAIFAPVPCAPTCQEEEEEEEQGFRVH